MVGKGNSGAICIGTVQAQGQDSPRFTCRNDRVGRSNPGVIRS
ncbi:MAG TPA: hypothetical protein PLP19_19010 [bacterium]|nr:hypothetical protein [bacterium]HPN45587.1 hypothetical protein [bacterium]